MTILKVEHLSKIYADKTVLHDINLEITAPGVYLIVGPNGSGKTTLLETLVGLRRATSGQYTVIDENQKKNLTTSVSFLTQENTLRPSCYVKEEIKLIQELYDLPDFDYHQFLAQYGLEDYLNHKTNKLSGGTQRRLLLALTLLANQSVIVLDEPVSGLDTFSRNEIWQMIVQASKEKIILVSDHYLNQSADYSDYVFLLNKGRMLASGNIKDIVQQTGVTHTIKVRRDDSESIVMKLQSNGIDFVKKSSGTVDIFYLTLNETSASLVNEEKILPVTFEDIYFYLTEGGVDNVQ